MNKPNRPNRPNLPNPIFPSPPLASPEYELTNEDLQKIAFSQALHKLQDLDKTLQPKTVQWIYQIKDLAILLASLSPEQLQLLAQTIKQEKYSILKHDLNLDLFG